MRNDPLKPVQANVADAVLLSRIAQGDRNAIDLLFRRHQARVFRFLARLVENEAIAEELVSEVFLEVWRHAGAFEARSRPATWLLAIARHKALSALRRRTADELDEETAERIEDPADNPEVTLEKAERHALLRDVVRQLPAAQRQIVDLVYYRERTIDDVAASLGIPLGTVKTRIFHARKRLGELLAARGVAHAFA
jgi:RNA polymerase sigma-70 factor (ECF subfamily)